MPLLNGGRNERIGSLTPEIHSPIDVEEGEDAGEQHLKARHDARQHDQRRQEYAPVRQEDVPVELLHYYLKLRQKHGSKQI